jgi:GLPGLI family protein
MKYLLIILFTSFSTKAQTSGYIEFKSKIVSQVIDTAKTKNDNVKQMMLNTVYKMKKQMPYATYELIFNDNKSVFKIKKKMSVDNTIDYKDVAGFSDADGEFFTESTKELRLRKIKAWNNYYIIRSSFSQWELKNQEKKILGYRCFKAVSKKELDNGDSIEVIAWFAKDLPFNFGPKEFVGLPGLILEIEERGIKFYATKVNLSNKNYNIKLPEVNKSISKKEFLSQSPYR